MMSERGASNLRLFNSEREERYIPLIQEELKKSKKRKMQFKSIGNLAEYIASVTDIHRTTLTRNIKYKSLLVSHLAHQRGVYPSDSDGSSPEVLHSRLLAAQLEISNLKAQIKRFKALIVKQETPTLPEYGKCQDSAPNENDYLAFVDTAMVLTALIERLKDTITIDLDSKAIVDLAAKPKDRVISGHPRTEAYINWLKEHESLLRGFSNRI